MMAAFAHGPHSPWRMGVEDTVPDREFAPSILVVDDDPHFRKFSGQVLKKAGYFVHDVCNGVEAKALIQRVHFDVVILDLNMPETDGFEVLKFACSELPNLKIIVASGFLQGSMLKAAKLLGAVATLDKPIEVDLLLSTVRTVLQSQKPNEG